MYGTMTLLPHTPSSTCLSTKCFTFFRFVGASSELQMATVSFVTSVCPSVVVTARINSAQLHRCLSGVKRHYNITNMSKFFLKSDKNIGGILHEELSVLLLLVCVMNIGYIIAVVRDEAEKRVDDLNTTNETVFSAR